VDDGHAISYKVLGPGVPVRAADGTEVGTVVAARDNEREQIFDGIVIATAGGQRFVDAPEVARIAERAVTLTLSPAEVAALPERDPKGGATYEAKAPQGALARSRFGRFLGGGGWKKR
jgi:hypothetical protein